MMHVRLIAFAVLLASLIGACDSNPLKFNTVRDWDTISRDGGALKFPVVDVRLPWAYQTISALDGGPDSVLARGVVSHGSLPVHRFSGTLNRTDSTSILTDFSFKTAVDEASMVQLGTGIQVLGYEMYISELPVSDTLNEHLISSDPAASIWVLPGKELDVAWGVVKVTYGDIDPVSGGILATREAEGYAVLSHEVFKASNGHSVLRGDVSIRAADNIPGIGDVHFDVAGKIEIEIGP